MTAEDDDLDPYAEASDGESVYTTPSRWLAAAKGLSTKAKANVQRASYIEGRSVIGYGVRYHYCHVVPRFLWDHDQLVRISALF
jgi:hypothetical protein